MIKLKTIEKRYPNAYRSDNGQRLFIHACEVGNNFFDYGDEIPSYIDFSLAPELKNDPRIVILTCDLCGGCAGW